MFDAVSCITIFELLKLKVKDVICNEKRDYFEKIKLKLCILIYIYMLRVSLDCNMGKPSKAVPVLYSIVLVYVFIAIDRLVRVQIKTIRIFIYIDVDSKLYIVNFLKYQFLLHVFIFEFYLFVTHQNKIVKNEYPF